MSRTATRYGLNALLLLLLLLAGCATVPPPRADRDWLSILPPESTFYTSLTGEAFQDLLIEAMATQQWDTKQLDRVLDLTDRVYAGLQIGFQQEPLVSVIAVGRYPGLLKVYLIDDDQWKRIGRSSFAHVTQQLQIAVPERDVVFLSNGGIDRLLARLKNPIPLAFPSDLLKSTESAAAVLYFPELPGGPGGQLERLPIQQLWLVLDQKENRYHLEAVFVLTEQRETRVVEILFRLAFTLWMRRAELGDLAARLKAMNIEVIERTVRISDLDFSKQELNKMLQVFLDQEAR